MKLYLAGKIDKNDWRHSLLPLRGAWDHYAYPDTPPPWPEIKFADIPATYVGPYFAGCDHGCTHGNSGHAASPGGCYRDLPGRETVPARCYAAIDKCDLFIAWLDDLTAYGTLVEIGYAKARGKHVVIGSPKWIGRADHLDDLWFAAASGRQIVTKTPQDLVRWAVEHYTPKPDPAALIESPAERSFWEACTLLKLLPGLTPQHKVDKYRLDFAIPPAKFAVEIDGHNYHSTPAQKASDTARQRDLEMLGWRIIRFTGREVYGDRAFAAAREADAFYRTVKA